MRVPPSTSRSAEKISPSWNSSVHWALSVPGNRPPMSMWWAIDPAQAISAPSPEERREDLQVGRVGAAHVRVVGQECVAGVDVVAPLLENGLQRELHQPELRGDLLGVRDHPPVGGEQAAVEVEHLADDRRVRRAVLDHRHLLGDVVERAGQDLLRDRVDRRGRHATPPPAPARAWRRRRPGRASPPGRRSWRPPARRSSPARSPRQAAATRDGRAPSGGRRPRRRPRARRLRRSAPWRPRARSSRSTGCGPGRGRAG